MFILFPWMQNAPGEGPPTGDAKALERSFLYCLAWGLGGLLDKKDRAAVDAELRKLTDLLPPGVRRVPAQCHLLTADCKPRMLCWMCKAY